MTPRYHQSNSSTVHRFSTIKDDQARKIRATSFTMYFIRIGVMVLYSISQLYFVTLRSIGFARNTRNLAALRVFTWLEFICLTLLCFDVLISHESTSNSIHFLPHPMYAYPVIPSRNQRLIKQARSCNGMQIVMKSAPSLHQYDADSALWLSFRLTNHLQFCIMHNRLTAVLRGHFNV